MFSSLFPVILVINELMASNLGEAMSPATNFDSWIEIYNPSDQEVSLGGMYLSDDADNLQRWKIPSGVGSVPANGYKVVWLGSDGLHELQANFKLDCDGGTIYLSDAFGNIVTSQDYPKAISHTSYARKSDGGDEWGWASTPTPGETNSTSAFASERLAPPVVDTDSRLFNGSFKVKVQIPEGATLMYSLDGSLPVLPKENEEEVSPWEDMITNGDCEGNDATCFVCRDADGNRDVNRIEDGIGFEGSRGIRVHAIANPKQDWSAQFFVYTPNHKWNANERYRFRMRVRADHECHISAQSHKKPGDYIHSQMLNERGYNVTTEWQEIVCEDVVTYDQAGTSAWGGWWGQPQESDFQTIAFNLNELRGVDNYVYFDDIHWEIYTDDLDKVRVYCYKSDDGVFNIDNTTNLTVRLFQDGYLPSVPVTRSYIKTSQKYTCPVVSIVGDQRYFTDPMWGIDIEGKNGIAGNGRNDPVNWNQDWDRPVNFSYITPDGKMAFNQDANISVSGGWTRMINPRSMKLKANKKFDGQNRFDYTFFPLKPYIRNKALVIRNGGNDVWETHSRFMDLALESIITRSGIDLDNQSYVQVAEYINGEFKGILNLREPNNDKYVDANYGYGDDEIDYFENFIFKNGDDVAWNRIMELGRKINDAGAYDELKTLLDIDVFCNYMAVELFLGNNDWPDNNIKAYRSREDGRYRFISFDLDYAFNRENPIGDLNNFKSVPLVKLFNNLLENDDFRKKFLDTYCLVSGSVFDKDRATAIVNEIADAMRPMSQLDGYTPDGAADKIKKNLKTQQDKMIKNLEKYKLMKLSGVTRQSVELSADIEGARIFVNEIEVPYAYLKGYLYAPAKLRAQAPAGYRFAGWKKGGEVISYERTIELPSDNSMSLTATFEAFSDEEMSNFGFTPVRINEVSPANGIFVNDYWKRNDWVELYNTTDAPIDVEGMYLSDNLDKPQKYQITRGESLASTIIPAHGYLIIWCDKEDPLSLLHASFKLGAEGGDVLLTAEDGSWSDHFTYTQLEADQTAGRWPDGCGDIYLMEVPTIAKPNLRNSYMTLIQEGPNGIKELKADAGNGLNVAYTAGRLVISSQSIGNAQVVVHNLAGQTVASLSATLSGGYAEVPLANLANGIYVAVVSDAEGNKASVKFIR